MGRKAHFWASVSLIATMSPSVAYAGPLTSEPEPQNAQETPKPVTASDQTANPSAPALSEQISETTEGDIVVTGLRRSLESAQQVKRNSDGIVDAIVAEDIGKLPDTFASAALARVTGVQVTRGGGEAAGVQIRGLPDISTTYNGREIFTAEGRFVQIQDFPAGTVAALEVYKSGTANLIEGGIGGQVNVRGRRPFDFNGFELSGSLNGVNWEQSGELSWNGNLLISDRWETGIGEMGLLVNASYVGINFMDATREQSLVIGTTNPDNAPGTTGGVRYPDAQGLFYGYGDRFRPSANAAFQWRPTPELEIYVDGLFQGYRGKDENRFLFFPIFGGPDFQLTNIQLRDGTNIAQSATVTGANAPDGYYGSAEGRTDTYQLGGGAIWKRGGLQISGDIAYTDSTYSFDLVNVDHAFASSPVRDVVFEVDGNDGGPSLNFQNFDVTDPANFLSRGFFQENLRVSGKDVQTRFDAQYDFDGGFVKRIQAGVRYNDRDAARDRGTAYIFNLPAGIPITALPVSTESTRAGFAYNDAFPIRTFAAIPSSSIRENLPELRAFYGAPEGQPAFNPTENFTANEKSYAAYAQLKYGFDVSDTMTIDGLIGLRAVKTETTITGFVQEEPTPGTFTFTPTTAENDYVDYLPNVSARLGFTEELQMRLNYTQTRTRPNFFDLNPTLTVGPPPTIDPNNPPNPNDPNSNLRNITGGNPDLNPLTSDNYDISLEWYFSRSGSLTAAVFRRDAQGFVSRVAIAPVDVGFGPSRLDLPENTGNTRFQGAELAFTSFLDIEGLPEWAKGFGIQANATYVDSQGDLAQGLAASPNVAGQQVRFNGVSEWSGNVVALYERPFFSARAAYNYRSDFVQFYSIEPLDVGADGSPRTRGVVEKGRGQLDFSTTVTPVPNMTIAFDIVNVLGNPLRRYREFNDSADQFARQILYLERTYSLGVRFRF
ncbi:TonB-dependent receptor [Sphingomonas qomolangmaensis]|uniref:TonB-dependent receptor n=1 Tax=Sphingomonas qomolangmaensis TaxID=2918765 RepID=A0ABY5LAK1_9SPHN|nr:TonB-dependent receptor [Sphingomonas qomolangmaensis]UUL83998.1 TonB-dependent receptor [Sphingomonas qomolangmaensis]